MRSRLTFAEVIASRAEDRGPASAIALLAAWWREADDRDSARDTASSWLEAAQLEAREVGAAARAVANAEPPHWAEAERLIEWLARVDDVRSAALGAKAMGAAWEGLAAALHETATALMARATARPDQWLAGAATAADTWPPPGEARARVLASFCRGGLAAGADERVREKVGADREWRSAYFTAIGVRRGLLGIARVAWPSAWDIDRWRDTDTDKYRDPAAVVPVPHCAPGARLRVYAGAGGESVVLMAREVWKTAAKGYLMFPDVPPLLRVVPWSPSDGERLAHAVRVACRLAEWPDRAEAAEAACALAAELTTDAVSAVVTEAARCEREARAVPPAVPGRLADLVRLRAALGDAAPADGALVRGLVSADAALEDLGVRDALWAIDEQTYDELTSGEPESPGAWWLARCEAEAWEARAWPEVAERLAELPGSETVEAGDPVVEELDELLAPPPVTLPRTVRPVVPPPSRYAAAADAATPMTLLEWKAAGATWRANARLPTVGRADDPVVVQLVGAPAGARAVAWRGAVAEVVQKELEASATFRYGDVAGERDDDDLVLVVGSAVQVGRLEKEL